MKPEWGIYRDTWDIPGPSYGSAGTSLQPQTLRDSNNTTENTG